MKYNDPLKGEWDKIQESDKIKDSKCECSACLEYRMIDMVAKFLFSQHQEALSYDLRNWYQTVVKTEKTAAQEIGTLRDLKREMEHCTKDLISELDKSNKEFETLEDAYDDLEEKLVEGKKENDRKEELIKNYQGQIKSYNARIQELESYTSESARTIDNTNKENQRLLKALETADKKVTELQSKQSHPGDVKMGAIIKKAYQDLQAAELEKNLCKPDDYKLPKNNWK